MCNVSSEVSTVATGSLSTAYKWTSFSLVVKWSLHCFTRSEYCRNVKLKYCLEAEGAWAEGFRAKLGKGANEGGFTGTLTPLQSSDVSTAFCSLAAVFIRCIAVFMSYSSNYRC